MNESEGQLSKMTLAETSHMPRELRRMLREDPAHLAAILHRELRAQKPRPADLWQQDELPIGHWILLLSGVNQEDECEIARSLLLWEAFFSKDSAKVRCLQSSERREWQMCAETFGISRFPTIILGDSPDMNTFIRLDPQFLFALMAQPGHLQRFLTVRRKSRLDNLG